MVINSLHDLINQLESFTLKDNSTWQYKAKFLNNFGDAALYVKINNGWECVGYIYPHRRNKIKIKVRRQGLEFESLIKFSDIIGEPIKDKSSTKQKLASKLHKDHKVFR